MAGTPDSGRQTPDLPPELSSALSSLGYVGAPGLLMEQTPREVDASHYYWRDIRSKLEVAAVYFQDGSPLVAFSADGRPGGLVGLRQGLWNYGRIPLLVNATEDGVSVYSTDSPAIGSDERAGRLVHGSHAQVADGIMRAFSKASLDSGIASRPGNLGSISATSVESTLLRNLRAFRRRFSAPTGGVSSAVAALDSLTIASITAMYLADRQILSQAQLIDLTGYPTVHSALESGRVAIRQFFSALARRFNGDIFNVVSGSLTEVSEAGMAALSSLLRGDDIETGQESLWPYDFSILPADLVSMIYEQLLGDNQRSGGSYFTPPFLVDAILDEVLPWNSGTASPRILDLACGSGAFLTEAFKRLVFRRVASTDGSRELSIDSLTHILRSCIFGVDIDPAAARVATFGLYLALLEESRAPEEWQHELLPSLIGENILIGDAFDSSIFADETFDIAATNPPWGSGLSASAAAWLDRRKLAVTVPDRQMASAFLWLNVERLAPGGQLGVVMPAKTMLHNRSEPARAFRQEVFQNLDVSAVVDLSAVRHSVFANATAPTAIILATKPVITDSFDLSRSTYFTHVVVHPRRRQAQQFSLAVLPEEVRVLSRNDLSTIPEAWKVLVWGSLRDLRLIERLSSRYPRLGDIAAARGWFSSRGFQIAGGDRLDTSQLQGLRRVDTKDILPLRLVGSEEVFLESYAHRPRDRKLFTAPTVLIRRGIVDRQIAAVVVDADTTFPDAVIGVSAPSADRSLLVFLALVLTSSFGIYWHFMTSSSWGIERDYVEYNEHMRLPFVEPGFDECAQADAILSRSGSVGIAELRSQVDDLVFQVYGLTELERDRVVRGAAESIGRFYRGETAELVEDERIQKYVSTLQGVLKVTLDGLDVWATYFSRELYRTVAVVIGDDRSMTSSSEPLAVDTEHLIQRLDFSSQTSTGLVAVTGGLYFAENVVYIVKSGDADRWTHDAAMDDADRIIAGLLEL